MRRDGKPTKDTMDLCQRCVRSIRGVRQPVRNQRIVTSVDDIPVDDD